MPLTYAERMKASLEEAMTSTSNVVAVDVDGLSIRFDHDSAREAYDYWCRKVARERGTRPFVAQIKLSGF